EIARPTARVMAASAVPILTLAALMVNIVEAISSELLLTTTCSVVEEVPLGSPVCSLAQLLNHNATGRFQQVNDSSARLFSVDPASGLVRTSGRIDREGIPECRRPQPVCALTLQTTWRGADNSQMLPISATIRVLDVNDNAPRFRGGAVLKASLQEHDRSASFQLPRAVDPDAGENGSVVYSLHPEAQRLAKFSLVDDPHDRLRGPVLLVVGDVNLERDPGLLRVLVLARDKGQPSLNSSFTMELAVINTNDFDPALTPKDPQRDRAVERVTKNPVERVTENPVERVTENPVERVTENPVERVPDNPVERVTENQVERVNENPVERVPDNPVERVPENPVERVTENPVERVTEYPERVTENPVERVTENPVERVTENPVERVTENPVERVTENPVERVTENPVERVTENPVERVTEKPERVTENPVERVTENPVERVTENPVERVTENPLERVTENPVERVTENPVERVTENPVERVTENPVERVTENPVERVTENPVERIPENTSVNSVVLQMSASDKDEFSKPLTFSIINYDCPPLCSPFAIHPRSGEIVLTSALDAETQQRYEIYVSVTDNHPPSPRTSVSIVKVLMGAAACATLQGGHSQHSREPHLSRQCSASSDPIGGHLG
uniref:Cadherin domain-containing protein n=1 Tax=Macrostomum lignano TaxID=282301 RepID=A0A1I8IUR9_9PLAT